MQSIHAIYSVHEYIIASLLFPPNACPPIIRWGEYALTHSLSFSGMYVILIQKRKYKDDEENEYTDKEKGWVLNPEAILVNLSIYLFSFSIQQ